MGQSPSHLWRELPPATRVAAAEAFWRDQEAFEQQAEAIVQLARKLNFRTKSLQSLPVERRARFLAQLNDVSDALAGRALIAYHFRGERQMMGAFLDALGIEHEEGLIAAEEVQPPARDVLNGAVEAIRGAFPADHVDLYLRTLVALDPETWKELDAMMDVTSTPAGT
jgi:hypothetical protein